MGKVRKVVIDDETGEILEESVTKSRMTPEGYRLYWNMPRKLNTLKLKVLLPRCKGYEALLYYAFHMMPYVREDGLLFVGGKRKGRPLTKTDMMRICKIAQTTASHVMDASCERGILRKLGKEYFLNPVVGCPLGIVTPFMFSLWANEMKHVMPKWAFDEMVLRLEGLG